MSGKTPNHALSPLSCPVKLEDVDLFSPGAQEHWYEAYPILHRECPVVRLPGEGYEPGTDGFILTKYEDISAVVRDPVRFPPTLTLAIRRLESLGVPLEEAPQTNAMIVSMATLRPTNELYRAHRQELTDPWVGPGASRHTEMITRFVDQLIDNWIDRGEVEFISEFARPLPQMVMATVLGYVIHEIQTSGRGRILAEFRTSPQVRELFEQAVLEREAALASRTAGSSTVGAAR